VTDRASRATLRSARRFAFGDLVVSKSLSLCVFISGEGGELERRGRRSLRTLRRAKSFDLIRIFFSFLFFLFYTASLARVSPRRSLTPRRRPSSLNGSRCERIVDTKAGLESSENKEREEEQKPESPLALTRDRRDRRDSSHVRDSHRHDASSRVQWTTDTHRILGYTCIRIYI